MTNIPTTRNVAAALIPTLIAALLIQACGGGGDAVAQASALSRAANADPVEGTWESAVTLRDCASGNPLRTFKGLTVLHRGGTASATNNQPPGGLSPGFGGWRRDGAASSDYVATFRLFRFNPDGSYAGAQNLTRRLTLGGDGNSLTGTISAQLLDPAENVLQTVCGTETATRTAAP